MGAAWLPPHDGRLIYRHIALLLVKQTVLLLFLAAASPMILSIIASIVIFTYWAYYRVVYKQEKQAWADIERVALLLVVFLIMLYFIIG